MSHRSCQPEIGNPCIQISIKKDVVGLDVAMDNLRVTIMVEVVQSLSNSNGYVIPRHPIHQYPNTFTMFLCRSLPRRLTSPKRSSPFSMSGSVLHNFFTATAPCGLWISAL